jgi:hypothetical protein
MIPQIPRVLAMAALVAAGCGRVPGQFEILNDQVPTTGCLIPTEPTVYMGMGTLDLSIVRDDVGTAYFVYPLIENNLPGSTSSSGGLDPNQIQLSGFNVDISAIGTPDPSAAAALSAASQYLHFQVPWSGGVSSAGGRVSASVAALPVPLARALAATGTFSASPSMTLKLTIQAIGRTNSGTGMQSDPFEFPLRVCSGCLVENVSACPYAATPADQGEPCNPAQDLPVDCCTENGALVCPATVAAQ